MSDTRYFKYDREVAAYVQYTTQQVMLHMDRAQFATSQWDSDYWFTEAMRLQTLVQEKLTEYREKEEAES